jgi:hypothetical protein
MFVAEMGSWLIALMNSAKGTYKPLSVFRREQSEHIEPPREKPQRSTSQKQPIELIGRKLIFSIACSVPVQPRFEKPFVAYSIEVSDQLSPSFKLSLLRQASDVHLLRVRSIFAVLLIFHAG